MTETAPLTEVADEPSEALKQAFIHGQQAMERMEQAVTTFELEIGYHGEAFSHLAEKTDELDDMIEALAQKISQAKLGWARASVKAIEADIQQVSDVVRRARQQDDDVSQLRTDLEVLRENREIAVEERGSLERLGIATSEIDRRIEAFDRALSQLEKTIEGPQDGGAPQAVPAAVQAARWKAELIDLTQQVMLLIRELLSEESDVWAKKDEAEKLRDRWENIPQLEGNRDWETAEKTVTQMERAVGQRLSLHMVAFLNDQLAEVHAQAEGARSTDDSEDIPVLRENWAALEENIMVVGQQLNDLPESSRTSVTEHLNIVVAEWRRLEMIIDEAEQRLRLSPG